MSDSTPLETPELKLIGQEPVQPIESREATNRRLPRLKLPAMYTLVRAKRAGTAQYQWTGHIYDISASGMRFELDQAFEMGAMLEVRGMLPGTHHMTFRAIGRVVRLHDDVECEPGPVRMGMHFDRFETESDARRLNAYLTDHGIAA